MKRISSLIFAIVVSAPPSFAQILNDGLSADNLKNHIFVSEIVICSEISGVNDKSVSAFYEEYFAGWQPPHIRSGIKVNSQNLANRLLFVVSDGTVGNTLRTCLRHQDMTEGALEAYIEQQAQRLQSPLGALEGIKLPSYYNPAYASWGYKDIDDWHVVSFTSREKEPYRTNHAITNLFGLDTSICEHSDACVQDN
ncbi:MAG: hypothetical protein ABJD13_02425 [Paracoccaceae bacterium]